MIWKGHAFDNHVKDSQKWVLGLRVLKMECTDRHVYITFTEILWCDDKFYFLIGCLLKQTNYIELHLFPWFLGLMHKIQEYLLLEIRILL